MCDIVFSGWLLPKTIQASSISFQRFGSFQTFAEPAARSQLDEEWIVIVLIVIEILLDLFHMSPFYTQRSVAV